MPAKKTHDSKGRARRASQGGAGPKKIPDKNAAKSGKLNTAPPSHLGEHGREWWAWAVDRLEVMGILDAADRAMLELAAETMEDYRMAQEDIQSLGTIIAQETDGSTIYKRNPALTTMEKARAMLRSFYSDLGLTPSARAKFGGGEDDDDPMAELFRKSQRN